MRPDPTDFGQVAAWFDASLRTRVMPYWLRTAPDLRYGGFHLCDPRPGRTRRPPFLTSARHRACSPCAPFKSLVIQSRMLYGFSLAHRLGWAGTGGDYLQAAEHGYRFIRDRMYDREHGGLLAIVDLDGSPRDSRKLLYSHAFAIVGLVEFHRASGNAAALELALDTYRHAHSRLHDARHGGWIEHADRHFQPLRFTHPPPGGLVGVAELKSADALLHWMEALAELLEASRCADVAGSLAEALRFNRTCFFPVGHARAYQLRTADWRPIGGSRYDVHSYGHAVQFAWLMIRAERVLGVAPSWEHFHGLLAEALYRGLDRARGGMFLEGPGTRPAADRRKVWWVQAEAIAALADGLRDRNDPDYATALTGLLTWVLRYHILSEDEVWIAATDEVGRPLDVTKAGPWKGAYHDVRAMTKFVEVFG